MVVVATDEKALGEYEGFPALYPQKSHSRRNAKGTSP